MPSLLPTLSLISCSSYKGLQYCQFLDLNVEFVNLCVSKPDDAGIDPQLPLTAECQWGRARDRQGSPGRWATRPAPRWSSRPPPWSSALTSSRPCRGNVGRISRPSQRPAWVEERPHVHSHSLLLLHWSWCKSFFPPRSCLCQTRQLQGTCRHTCKSKLPLFCKKSGLQTNLLSTWSAPEQIPTVQRRRSGNIVKCDRNAGWTILINYFSLSIQEIWWRKSFIQQRTKYCSAKEETIG